MLLTFIGLTNTAYASCRVLPNGGVACTANTPISTVLSANICNIVDNVKMVVGIIALAMLTLGGVMYAIAHLLPAAGNVRGNMTGWATGMMAGGVIGIILVGLAPGIISAFVQTAGLSGKVLTSCGAI